MTLNGAIMQLVELSEHPMMPAIFRPAIQKVIETISELEENPEPHWIPVTERLSEVGENVLLSYFDEITIGWLNSDGLWSIYDGWKCVNADEVSAWMPLPEPYKGVTT